MISMRLATSLLYTVSLAAIAYGYPGCESSQATGAETNFQYTCERLAAAISGASGVYFPRVSPGDQATPQYLSDISHVYSSSSQESACSVEPGSADDVSRILCILGSTRTPFAVKGGGHTPNPGFSSTMGVQISMTRFKDISVDSAAGTVEVGAGRTWDQVYAALEPYGITVVGARTPGVGVAGCTLGGCYSWKSSQYGLTIDNIEGYELVLPNGAIKAVKSNDEDLWFGLRGGLNNFGIVTKFVFKSHPQGEVWGGSIFYAPDQLDAFKDATVRFSQYSNDAKASTGLSLAYASGTVAPFAVLFYDAPTPPQGIFDDFLAIPNVQKDVSSRSYYDLVSSLSFLNPSGNVSTRTLYSEISVTRFSPAVIDAFVKQIALGGRFTQLDQTFMIGAGLEPLNGGIFSHGSQSAYPPDRSQAFFPSVLQYLWSNASLDHIFAGAIREQSTALHNAALADGQNVSHAAVYMNYALFDTPLEDIYGANLPRLRKIRSEIDPNDVMGLAGGFKF